MNIDQLLLDIIKDKCQGHYQETIKEVIDQQGLSKIEVEKVSIRHWFNIEPDTNSLNNNKNKNSRLIFKHINRYLPFYIKVKPILYLYFLKINDRDALLSNSDD